jgi:hypothetical protein
LKDVTASGGQWGACPQAPGSEDPLRKEKSRALSPELNQRLLNEFPAGSSEKHLVETLRQQGFELLAPCDTDASVHSASFTQHGGGIFSYPLTANVSWKVDDFGHVVWTQGFVRFMGM